MGILDALDPKTLDGVSSFVSVRATPDSAAFIALGTAGPVLQPAQAVNLLLVSYGGPRLVAFGANASATYDPRIEPGAVTVWDAEHQVALLAGPAAAYGDEDLSATSGGASQTLCASRATPFAP